MKIDSICGTTFRDENIAKLQIILQNYKQRTRIDQLKGGQKKRIEMKRKSDKYAKMLNYKPFSCASDCGCCCQICSIYCMLYAIAALLFSPITSGALVNGMVLIASVLLNAQSLPISEWHFRRRRKKIEEKKKHTHFIDWNQLLQKSIC